MTRLEIRRRALRAATAVSLTTLSLGLLGCDGTITVDGDEGSGAPDVDPTPTASASATAPPTIPILPITTADAGATPCPCPPDQEMLACCEAVSWSFECGCEAWGPPMPPSMEVG